MKKVTFECSNESVALFVLILSKLFNSNGHDLKIRVGGDEYKFYGDFDSVTDILVDGNPVSNTDMQSLTALRSAAINALTPVVPVVPVTPSVASTPSKVLPTPVDSSVPVGDATNADDEDDETDDLLNSSDAIEVKDVVSSKISQGAMFTAFDITKELRSKGSKVQHRNIKPIVHALFTHGDMNGYSRSLIDINGAPIQPFLYHPINVDPETYQS